MPVYNMVPSQNVLDNHGIMSIPLVIISNNLLFFIIIILYKDPRLSAGKSQMENSS